MRRRGGSRRTTGAAALEHSRDLKGQGGKVDLPGTGSGDRRAVEPTAANLSDHLGLIALHAAREPANRQAVARATTQLSVGRPEVVHPLRPGPPEGPHHQHEARGRCLLVRGPPGVGPAVRGCTGASELVEVALGLTMDPGLPKDHAHRRRGGDTGAAVVVVMPGERWRKSFRERAEAVISKCSDEKEIQLLREAASKLLLGGVSGDL